MAIGSNTLGLLFKIGVDAGDAVKTVDDLKTSVSTSLVQGFKDGANSASKELPKIGDEFHKLLTPLNEARRGFNEVFSGDVTQGTINLTRAMGPLGIAIGGVAIAAAGVAFAIKGAIDAAHDIGTTSKEDFDALQKKVQSAGESITELQRAMAAGVLDALDKISGATTAFFAKVLEKDGPAIIALLNEIAGFITGTLIPLVGKYGDTIADMIARTIALGRVLTKDFSLKDYLTGLPTLQDDFNKALADARAEIAAINPEAKTLVETTKAHKAALKDLTQAQLEENEAARALAVQREDAVAQNAEIDRQLRAQAITADEALGKRLAILQNTKFFEDAFFDAQQKRIEAEVQGDKRRTDALEQNANQREIATKKEAEAQIEAATQQDKDQTKFTESRLKQLDEILKKEKDLDEIIAARAREHPPGAPVSVEQQVPGLPPPIPLPPTSIFDDLGAALKNSGAAFTTWSDFASKAISGVAGATENLLETFILTGKGGGQAFKQLAASIIASLAVEAGVRALMEVAFGIADLAKAATLAADPFTAYLAPGFVASAHAHFAAAAQFGIIAGAAAAVGVGIGLAGGLGGGSKAAAGAGGFGGTSDQAPGTVTVNQGGGATLGVLLSIDNHLSNITTAPPGDILQRGADQNPMAVGQANNEAARRDGTVSREFLQISGLRTA